MTEVTLANGLRVVISPQPGASLTALKLFTKIGSRHDGSRPGIAHFTEHLMLHRSSRMPPATEEIEALGGELNAVTHREYTALQAVVLPRYVPQVLQMFGDLLQPLELTAGQVDRERQVIVREIEHAGDAQSAAWDLFLSALWGDDAFTRPVHGDPATIRDLRSEELAEHFARYVAPERMVLAVAGPLRPGDVLESAGQTLATLAGSPWHDDFAPRSTVPTHRRLLKDTNVTHLIVGVDAVPLADPRRPAVKVLDMVLGHGAGSRLPQILRGRWGLVYETATASMGFEDRGYLCAYTSCAPGDVGRVLEIVLGEFERLPREPLAEAELEAARMRYEGVLARRFETVLSLAGIAGIEALLGCSESFAQAVARVRGVDADQAQRAAAELIDLDRLAIASVGPPGASAA